MIRYFSESTIDRLLQEVKSSLPMNTEKKILTILNFIQKVEYLLFPKNLAVVKREAGWGENTFTRIKALVPAVVKAYVTF